MRIVNSYISLHNLRFYAYHGVLPQEQQTGGNFTVNVKVAYPVDNALCTDNVGDTLNYAELYEIINKEMLKPSCLLEHVAGRIGESIFRQFPSAIEVWLGIVKHNPPMGADTDGAEVEVHLVR